MSGSMSLTGISASGHGGRDCLKPENVLAMVSPSLTFINFPDCGAC